MRAAAALNLRDSTIVSAIFKAREVVWAPSRAAAQTAGPLDEVRALGWRVLHEEPGREIVMGAVTQPWQANVVFRGLSPEESRRSTNRAT